MRPFSRNREQAGGTRLNDPLLTPSEIVALVRVGRSLRLEALSSVEPEQGRIGETPARRRGSGTDFAETRGYQPGDDPRHIHWRATARTGRTELRTFYQELSPIACLVVDRRAGMRFGTRRRLKVVQAARLALVLAAREERLGSRLAGLLLDAESCWLPPAGGPAALQRLAHSLARPCPPMDDEPPLPRFVHRVAHRTAHLPEGSRLYLVSDFHDVEDADAPVLGRLGRRFPMLAVRVQDPSERLLPAAGAMRLWWDGRARLVDTGGAAVNDHLGRVHADREQDLQRLFARVRVRLRSLDTGTDDPVEVLLGRDS